MIKDKVVVVDYGIGNIYSVSRALDYCGAENVCVSSSFKDIQIADKLILPGVGAFADGMNGLMKLELVDAIKHHVSLNKPLLGICLGMQLLATSSEEFGSHDGLDLIPGNVLAIPKDKPDGSFRKIPFIGWSSLIKPHLSSWNIDLMSGIDDEMAVYLIHSYYFDALNEDNILAYYDCMGYKIAAAVNFNKVYGFQFHPEKSGEVGLRLIKNFLLST